MKYLNARNTAFGEDRRTYKETDSGVSATQRVFNVNYDNSRVEAYLNGVRLFPGDDYTKASSGIGTSITLASDLGSNNVLEVVGYQGINSGNALVEDNFVVGTASTGSGGSYTNSTTVFPVASSAGDTVSVWRNGVKLVPTTDYTVQASASTVTLLSPASSADEITVQVVGGVIHNNGLTVNSGNDSFFLPTTRGTDNYVLTRDDSLGTGGTAWKETVLPPTISSITYPTQNGVQATALAATGAQDVTAETLLINGQGFTPTVTVNISGNGVSSSAFAGTVSVNGTGTVITCSNVTKRASADNYTLTVTNSTGLNTTTTVNFSGDPSFTTASGNIANVYAGVAMPTQTITAASSVTWYEGTTPFPAWITHFADGASGTSQNLTATNPTNTGTSTIHNFNIIIRDSENQSHNRDFSITVVDFPTGDNGNATVSIGGTDYYVMKFTSDGTLTLYKDATVDYLLIGGGGSGGAGSGAGGGGAGMFLTGTGLTLSAGAYAIDIGAGGIPSSDPNGANNDNLGQGGPGSPTKITRNSDSTVMALAIGGGTGGNELATASGKNGRDGGSGGGGFGYSTAGSGGSPVASFSSYTGTQNTTSITYSGQTAVIPSGGLYYGNDGGAGGSSYYGGGGGGAGADGGTSNGGNGLATMMGLSQTNSQTILSATNITAGVVSSGVRYLAGGGGGHRQSSTTTSSGGLGGGGAGGAYSASVVASGTDGTANTGSGGGGSWHGGNGAGDGGSGIIILRFAIS